MFSVLAIVAIFIQLYSLVVLARVIMSWIPLQQGGPWEPVFRFVYDVTEPPLAAIRSVVPPVRMAAGALDLAPLLLLVGLQLIGMLLTR